MNTSIKCCESEDAIIPCDGCVNLICDVCYSKNTFCESCILDNPCNFCMRNLCLRTATRVCKGCRKGCCNECAVVESDVAQCPECFGRNLPKPQPRRRRQPPKRDDNVLMDDCEIYPSANLAKLVKLVKLDINKINIAQIHNRLRTRYEIMDPVKFLEAIYNTNSAVVGSFNLEIMLGESYDGDLDICCGDLDIVKLLPKQYCLIENDIGIDARLIQRVDTYRSLSRGIKIIKLAPNISVDAYIELSDMTIVKNKFDGRNFYIHSLDTLEKRGTVSIYNADRVKKYFDRGFELHILLTLEIMTKIFN